MNSQQKILISHPNSLGEGSQSFSPPSTTLTPSSTPSDTPKPSNPLINNPNIAQIASLATSQIANQQIAPPFMFQPGVNQAFNNGMLNTALFNDPALLQLYFTNFLQGNHALMNPMYPYGCGYAPFAPGAPAVMAGSRGGVPTLEGSTAPPLIFKDNPEPVKTQDANSVVSPSSANAIACEGLGQAILSTPERTKQEITALTDKTGIIESVDDSSLKKRRKECSIDSVSSVVETVATETNSNVDECSAGKKSRNAMETRSFEHSQEADVDAENVGEDEISDNQMGSIQGPSQYTQMRTGETRQVSSDFSSSGGSVVVPGASHEDDVFLSNDRKTSFEKIMRIHSSLIGSLSWTVPANKDDVVLKSLKDGGASGCGETPSNSSSSANKGDDAGKPAGQGANDDYNPFIQRDYSSSNVTCFSPRMLPDWQLNWLRDVTRSLSNVPKSPMTGIHFDRTKPAWAVSYYECETRKYYFFFIPDLSEYTIEITLAAAIGCRQNVVARGAHKRKKPGVLTFNLYSGQFEKSSSETPTANEGNTDHSGACGQRSKKSTVAGAGHVCSASGKPQFGASAGYPASGASSNINASMAAEFPRNASQAHTNGGIPAVFAQNRGPVNLFDPAIGQNSVHPGIMASLMHGSPHALMMDAFQQNALRNASLLYATALSSTGALGACGAGSSPQLPIHNPPPHPIAVPASMNPIVGVGSSPTVPNDAGIVACVNPVMLSQSAIEASTASSTPAQLTPNSVSLGTAPNPQAISISNCTVAEASSCDGGKLASIATTDSAYIPVVSALASGPSLTSESTGSSSVVLSGSAVDELAQPEKESAP
ncbi:hypothetical protein OIY81_1785 [Cryptosporidium canis]|uniref:Uncharacterized protein n=1 Tax=Cryptosporidium canis TaxID=195482 RepID=A0ABQ8P9E9_9CRYT|nr:hypothetical protein OJ252_2019 [Cryptosporidium canis]KAJ1611157.1 hypothetical protein OIY81_1785 [Cryptosporidium canis]